MPLPKAPTKMGEIIKGESKRKTQIRKKLEKESSDASKTSKQKKVDVNKLVSLAKKPIKKPEMPLAADKEKVGIMSGISRVNEFIVPIDGVKVLIFVVATFMLDLSMVTAGVIISKHCLK